uniref:Uncharacterized protein n=1 Tax=Podoviridae sp. ctxqo3 TaxID=2827755 RepID=A0A8S5SYK9_9CAUD|nr:MAG TPA: hypothetical protein [Podoviridae sp. ctxqo3]
MNSEINNNFLKKVHSSCVPFNISLHNFVESDFIIM